MAYFKLKDYFPRIYRFITEQDGEIVLLNLIVIIALYFISNDLLRVLGTRKEYQENRQKLFSQIDVWDDTLVKYPGYRDGYFHNAILSYQLGNTANSQTYLDRTMQLDPEFAYGIVLKALLNK